MELPATAARASGSPRRPAASLAEESLFTEEYLVRRPLLAGARASGAAAGGAADRRGRPRRRRVRGVPARAARRGDASRSPSSARFAAAHPPIVVLTSNRTRDLHDALKRRCLYHWIDYPDVEREVEIVRRRVPETAARAGGRGGRPPCGRCARPTCRSRRGSPRRSTGSPRCGCSGSSTSTPPRPSGRSAPCSSTARTRSSSAAQGLRAWLTCRRRGRRLRPCAARRPGSRPRPTTRRASRRALELAPPGDARGARTSRPAPCSCRRRDQEQEFDRVFRLVFEGLADPADFRGDPNAPRLERGAAAPAEARAGRPARRAGPRRRALAPPDAATRTSEREVPLAAASAEERSRARLRRARRRRAARAPRPDAQLALAPPLRLTRRRRRDPHGRRLDVRATLRAQQPDRRRPVAPGHAPARRAAAAGGAHLRRLGLDGALHAGVPAVPARVRRRHAGPRRSSSRRG